MGCTGRGPPPSWRVMKFSIFRSMQEVYGRLEEPDGLAGLVRLRAGGAQAADQLLAAEKSGAWSEALGLHEQVRVPLVFESIFSISASNSTADRPHVGSLPCCHQAGRRHGGSWQRWGTVAPANSGCRGPMRLPEGGHPAAESVFVAVHAAQASRHSSHPKDRLLLFV